jgi:hypothetical protein
MECLSAACPQTARSWGVMHWMPQPLSFHWENSIAQGLNKRVECTSEVLEDTIWPANLVKEGER